MLKKNIGYCNHKLVTLKLESFSPSKAGGVGATVVGNSVPPPVPPDPPDPPSQSGTFHGWSQTLISGLKTVPGAQSRTYR